MANVLADMKMDEATVASGLLHDTVEDSGVSVDELEELFGEEVADIVDGVTKIEELLDARRTYGSEAAFRAALNTRIREIARTTGVDSAEVAQAAAFFRSG